MAMEKKLTGKVAESLPAAEMTWARRTSSESPIDSTVRNVVESLLNVCPVE